MRSKWQWWSVAVLLAGTILVGWSLPALGQTLSGGFSDDFNDGTSGAWTTYGGTWSVSGGQYAVAGDSGDYGGKAVVNGPVYSNLCYEANVTPGAGGNAGLIFRVTNPATGADAYTGYYVGLDTSGNQVEVGKANNNWTQLAAAPLTVTAGTQYDLKVVAVGSAITVFVNGAQKVNLTDTSYASGAVGVRTFATNASFDNVVVTAYGRTATTFTRQFPYLGNDNGWQEELESDPGRQWLNLQGQPEDAIRTMAGAGLNAVRVTVENGQPLNTNPVPYNQGAEGSYSLPYGGVNEQVDIARRCKAYGMKVILTIDLGSNIPSAWASDTYEQMLTDIGNETVRLLDPFLQAGIQPDVIIAGDETNGGLLHYDSAAPAGYQDRYVDGSGNSSWQVGTGGQDAPANGTIAVFSDEATGSNTIWPKNAGFFKEEILSAKSEITAMGYNAAATHFGLHSQGTSATGYYDRIFGPHPNQPNFETDYYSNYDSGTTDLGNVSAVPQNLQNIKLSSLVDVLGVSFYPGHPVADGPDAAEADLEDIAYNGLQSNSTAQPLNAILADFATYGFLSNLSPTTGLYTAGPYQGEPAKQMIILETKGESNSGSYLVSDTKRANPQPDGNGAAREASFLTYFLDKLGAYPFVGGILYWEGEYAGFQPGTDLFSVNAPGNNGVTNYQALPILTTWGQFGAPSPTAAYTVSSADYGTAVQVGQYAGSWSSMQQLGPSLSEVFQAVIDPSGYDTFVSASTSDLLSTWNNSKTAGDQVEQTAASNPPTAGQEWSRLTNGSSVAQFINQGSGFALDTPNDASVLQDALSTAATEQWSLALLPRVNLVSGAGGVLDSGEGNLYGGQYASDQQLSAVTPVMSQQWQVINDQDGYYRIVCGEILSDNGNAPLVLGTWQNSTKVGDNVEQTGLGSTIQPGQEWSLTPISGSSAVQIINRNSGLALDVTSGPALQNTSNPSSAGQQWKLSPVY